MYVCAFSSSFSFSFSFSREQLETISTLEAKVGRRRLNLSTTTSLPPLIDLVYSARPPRRRRGRRRSGTQSCVALCWAGLGWGGCVWMIGLFFSPFFHTPLSFFATSSHRIALPLFLILQNLFCVCCCHRIDTATHTQSYRSVLCTVWCCSKLP